MIVMLLSNKSQLTRTFDQSFGSAHDDLTFFLHSHQFHWSYEQLGWGGRHLSGQLKERFSIWSLTFRPDRINISSNQLAVQLARSDDNGPEFHSQGQHRPIAQIRVSHNTLENLETQNSLAPLCLWLIQRLNLRKNLANERTADFRNLGEEFWITTVQRVV